MAITAFPAPVRLPAFDYIGTAFGFSGTWYLDGTSVTRFACIFQAPATGEIDTIETYIGFVSGANNVRWSIQDITAGGEPDGTEDAYRAIAKATGWQTVQPTATGSGGGARKAVTQGTFYAIVCQWDSTESGNYEPSVVTTNGNADLLGGTYLLSYNGAAWNKAAAPSAYPNLAVLYADGNYYPIANCRPTSGSLSTVTFGNGSTPDEIGLRFIPAVTLQVTGVWIYGDFDGDCDLVLYDSGGSVLTSLSLDPDVRATTGARYAEFVFPAAVALTAAATYRLVAKPTSATTITIAYFTVNAAALLQAWSCGTDWHYTARTDAGAWTETTTRRPYLGLIANGFDSSGGGGGGGGTGVLAGPCVIGGAGVAVF